MILILKNIFICGVLRKKVVQLWKDVGVNELHGQCVKLLKLNSPLNPSIKPIIFE